MRWFLSILALLACSAAWCYWKWYDYLDMHGTFYLTLEEDAEAIAGPGGVAVYQQVCSNAEDPIALVLQRGVLHMKGRQSYTSSLMLYLGDPVHPEGKGPFHSVRTGQGDELCVWDETRSGGYALRGVAYLPTELLALPAERSDTLRFRIRERLRPYPAEPPPISWWAEPWKILTSPW